MKKIKQISVALMVALTLISVAQVALATNLGFQPGDFAYVIFDYGINNILHCPIGIVIGTGFMAWGMVRVVQKGAEIIAICWILAGVIFIKADSLVSSISGTLF